MTMQDSASKLLEQVGKRTETLRSHLGESSHRVIQSARAGNGAVWARQFGWVLSVMGLVIAMMLHGAVKGESASLRFECVDEHLVFFCLQPFSDQKVLSDVMPTNYLKLSDQAANRVLEDVVAITERVKSRYVPAISLVLALWIVWLYPTIQAGKYWFVPLMLIAIAPAVLSYFQAVSFECVVLSNTRPRIGSSDCGFKFSDYYAYTLGKWSSVVIFLLSLSAVVSKASHFGPRNLSRSANGARLLTVALGVGAGLVISAGLVLQSPAWILSGVMLALLTPLLFAAAWWDLLGKFYRLIKWTLNRSYGDQMGVSK